MENQNKNKKYEYAQKRVKKIKSFYTHLTIYLIINAFFIFKNAAAIGWSGLISTISTISIFWGVGLIFHWYSVFGKNFIFNKKWEENKIKELMDKEKSDNFDLKH